MKKLFIAAMALAAMVSCSKDDASVFDSSKKSVSVTIENYAKQTRHVTNATPAAGADELVCASSSTLTIVFTDGGNLVKSFTLDEGKTTTDGVYTFHALPETVDGLFVIGSKAGVLSTIPASKTAAEAAWQADQEDAEWEDIVVYGAGTGWTQGTDCTAIVDGVEHTYAHYTANVNVAPYKARVEVSAITCSDLGAKNRDDDPATFGYETVTVTEFGLNGKTTTAQTLTTENVMTADVNADGKTVNQVSIVPETGKVWSWNIDPAATSNYLLTLKATVDAGTYYTVTSADRTITATKYTDANGDLAKFEAGHIYKMTIPFTESILDDDSSLICVTATVTIEDWVVVDDVKPVFGN